jgi:hypothetical protein
MIARLPFEKNREAREVFFFAHFADLAVQFSVGI